MATSRKITFEERELRGSRWRCLLATSGPRAEVAAFLTALAGGHATVEAGDTWLPNGLREPDEARLQEVPALFGAQHAQVPAELTKWWLAVVPHANTPNWDIASTCHLGDERRGLLLVEAKAHEGECRAAGKPAPKTANGWANHAKAEAAIIEARDGLNALPGQSGWGLSRDGCYQLSNRFAFAWKLASLGVPVVLVYLGFLHAEDMDDGHNRLLTSAARWRQHVLAHGQGIVPAAAWDGRIDVGGTPLVALIRSTDLRVSAEVRA